MVWYWKDGGGRIEGMGSWAVQDRHRCAQVLVLELVVALVFLHQRNSSHSRTASTGKRAWLLLGSWALKRYSINAQTSPGI